MRERRRGGGLPSLVRYNIALHTPTTLSPGLWLHVPSILGPLSYAKPSSGLHCGALWDREPRSSLPHLVYFPPSPPCLFKTPHHGSPNSSSLLIFRVLFVAFQRHHPLIKRDSCLSFYFLDFRSLRYGCSLFERRIIKIVKLAN